MASALARSHRCPIFFVNVYSAKRDILMTDTRCTTCSHVLSP